MRPYSKDLRERVVAAVDHGEGSQREVARRFRVSLTFVFRLLRRRRDADTLDPKPHGGGPTPALGPDEQQRLHQLIREQPDATLEQLRQLGGVTCSLTTLWRGVRRPALTPQKKNPPPPHRGPPHAEPARRALRRQGKTREAPRLGFVGPTRGGPARTP